MLKVRTIFVSSCCFALVGGLLVNAPSAKAAVIVNDSWADGGRNNGPDALDSNWWTSASSAGIEVSVGSLGLVTGGTGRGIHTIFPTQTLTSIGDKLIATYTFTTPATIGPTQTAAFRVGLFDTLGRAGLDADVPSSSGTPNALFGYFAAGTAALPGYMLDMDVSTGAEDLNFRQHDTAQTATTPTGRLMGTTTGFTSLSPNGPDGAYTFAPNTSYTGSITITRSSATELQLIGTLGASNLTVTDTFDSSSFGMLAFWANSAVFGSASVAGQPDNGVDFTNVKIEFIATVPEPAALAIVAMVVPLVSRRRRR